MSECDLPLDNTVDVQLNNFTYDNDIMAEVHEDVPTSIPGVESETADHTMEKTIVKEVDILVNSDLHDSSNDDDLNLSSIESSTSFIGNRRGFAMVIVLCLVNMLNYMDRFTLAGVLKDIKHEFGNLSNVEAGLLQTSFICVYMIASPIFGYLGDRYTRKYLMLGGIVFWCVVTMASSFIPGDMYSLFIVFRGLVGMGEASYSTIAPTLIADLFTDDKRKFMLMIFYFALPVGSGMGYVVGSSVAKLFNDWRYGLRVTPFLGIGCVALLIFFVKEPKRGAAEGGTHVGHTSWVQDIRALLRNKSFLLSSGGVTCVAFVSGALSFWAPTFILNAIDVQNRDFYSTPNLPALEARIGLIFGGITIASGFIGVALGSESARRLKRKNPRADPLVCAFGLLCCTPFLFGILFVARYNSAATWVLIFFGEVLLFLNWAIVADILLYVVVPTRRSTAEAFQILMSHLLGDAGSPFLIGEVSDLVKPSFHGVNSLSNFVSLQYAMLLTTFACVIGGGMFLMTALFVEQDKARVDRVIAEANEDDTERELVT